MQQEFTELLIGIAEIAVALAGFSGVVVVFGSRNSGTWYPGDRLKLGFLIESSLTAAGFSLAALLVLYSFPGDLSLVWMIISIMWGGVHALVTILVASPYKEQRRQSRQCRQIAGARCHSNLHIFDFCTDC